eukprot:gene12851-12951_t
MVRRPPIVPASPAGRAGTLVLLLLALGACNRQAEAPPPAEATEAAGPSALASGMVDNGFGTPVKDRVATIGLINKRNNITQDLVMKPGESRRVGNVIVKLATCERTAPWEDPQETGAFVQVFVEERAKVQDRMAWHKVFSGWLFRNTPSLNVVEHPVYDVWIKDCAMHFPGEEDDPAAAASKAAKPAGKSAPAPVADAPDEAPADAAPPE